MARPPIFPITDAEEAAFLRAMQQTLNRLYSGNSPASYLLGLQKEVADNPLPFVAQLLFDSPCIDFWPGESGVAVLAKSGDSKMNSLFRSSYIDGSITSIYNDIIHYPARVDKGLIVPRIMNGLDHLFLYPGDHMLFQGNLRQSWYSPADPDGVLVHDSSTGMTILCRPGQDPQLLHTGGGLLKPPLYITTEHYAGMVGRHSEGWFFTDSTKSTHFPLCSVSMPRVFDYPHPWGILRVNLVTNTVSIEAPSDAYCRILAQDINLDMVYGAYAVSHPQGAVLEWGGALWLHHEDGRVLRLFPEACTKVNVDREGNITAVDFRGDAYRVAPEQTPKLCFFGLEVLDIKAALFGAVVKTDRGLLYCTPRPEAD